MRVLFVAGWYPSSQSPGRGSFVADQVRAIVNRGVEVVVASWEPGLLTGQSDADDIASTWGRAVAHGTLPLATPRTWGAGVPVARLPAVVPGSPTLRHPADLARWQAATLVPFGRALMREWPFDLVHAHRGLPDAVAAVSLAADLDLPILTTEHDGSLERQLVTPRAITAYRSLVGRRRRLVAVSRVLADQAASLTAIPRSSIDVIPNLVDRDVFRPRLDVARDLDELLWVGNRKTSKGIDALIEAMSLLPVKRRCRLHLIGQAPSEAEDQRLRGMAADLGVADRIKFDPPASREAVAAAMSRAGLFVHPSPSESFGIVAVEALASGLPVVAVAPAIAELIGHDGALGEVADGSSAAALAAAIDRALARVGDFDRTAAVAASEPYGADRVAGEILAAYRALAPTADVGLEVSIGPIMRRRRPPGRSTLVVGLRRRSALDRLSRLPEAARTSLSVVTSIGDGAPPLGVQSWHEIDADATFRTRLAEAVPARSNPGSGRRRRIIAGVRHPIATLRGRRLYAIRPELAATARSSGVGEAANRLGHDAPIVALDADDVSVIRRAGLESRLALGILWWIADRHDEADTALLADRT